MTSHLSCIFSLCSQNLMSQTYMNTEISKNLHISNMKFDAQGICNWQQVNGTISKLFYFPMWPKKTRNHKLNIRNEQYDVIAKTKNWKFRKWIFDVPEICDWQKFKMFLKKMTPQVYATGNKVCFFPLGLGKNKIWRPRHMQPATGEWKVWEVLEKTLIMVGSRESRLYIKFQNEFGQAS